MSPPSTLWLRDQLRRLSNPNPQTRAQAAEAILAHSWQQWCERRTGTMPRDYRRRLGALPDCQHALSDAAQPVALAALTMLSVLGQESIPLALAWAQVLQQDRSLHHKALSRLMWQRRKDLAHGLSEAWEAAVVGACEGLHSNAQHDLVNDLIAVVDPTPPSSPVLGALLRATDRLLAQAPDVSAQANLLQRITGHLRQLDQHAIAALPTLPSLNAALQIPALRLQACALFARGIPPSDEQEKFLRGCCEEAQPGLASLAVRALSNHRRPVQMRQLLALASDVEALQGSHREPFLRTLCGPASDTALVYLAEHLDTSPWAAVTLLWLWRRRRIHPSQWAFFRGNERWACLLAPVWEGDAQIIAGGRETVYLHHAVLDEDGDPVDASKGRSLSNDGPLSQGLSLGDLRRRVPQRVWQSKHPWWEYLRHEPNPKHAARALYGCVMRSDASQRGAVLAWALDQPAAVLRWAVWILCYSQRGRAGQALAADPILAPALRQRLQELVGCGDLPTDEEGAIEATLALMLAAQWRWRVPEPIPQRLATAPVAVQRWLALRCSPPAVALELAQSLRRDPQVLVRSGALRLLATKMPEAVAAAARDDHPHIRRWAVTRLVRQDPEHPHLHTAATQQDEPLPARCLWQALLRLGHDSPAWQATALSCLAQAEDAQVCSQALDHLLRHNPHYPQLPEQTAQLLSPSDLVAPGMMPYIPQHHAAPILTTLHQHHWGHPAIARACSQLSPHPDTDARVCRALVTYAQSQLSSDPDCWAPILIRHLDAVRADRMDIISRKLQQHCRHHAGTRQTLISHLDTLTRHSLRKPRRIRHAQHLITLCQALFPGHPDLAPILARFLKAD